MMALCGNCQILDSYRACEQRVRISRCARHAVSWTCTYSSPSLTSINAGGEYTEGQLRMWFRDQMRASEHDVSSRSSGSRAVVVAKLWQRGATHLVMCTCRYQMP